MSSINFDNVYFLFIMIPLAVLFSIPFALAIRKENANGHNITSQVFHILMAVIIAFAAAGTSIQTIMTETNIYVVADVSYSTDKNLDTIDSYIANLDLPRNSKIGLVCFGKDCEIVSNMGDPDDLKSVREANVDVSETDIAGALEFTGELFRDDVIKRIVLITDGKQTDESDSYALTRAVDSLQSQNIRVDAIYLNDNIKENAKEVQISSARFTNLAYINSSEKAILNIDATYNTLAVMSIERDGEKIANRAIILNSGTNNIDLDLKTDEAGEYDYKVTVSADGDESDLNNTYTFTQRVTDEMKVLVYGSRNYLALIPLIENYPEGVRVDVFVDSVSDVYDKVYLNDLIDYFADNLNVKINKAKTGADLKFPNTLEEVCKYDVIILARSMSGMTPFLSNVETAVSQFGKTLLTVGNLNITDTNTTANKMLSDMLPVQFGRDNSIPKLYTIVIDTSYSMIFMSHFALAKTLAKRLVSSLNDGDEVCIISFSSKVRMVQAPTALNGGTRSDISRLIDALSMTQGSYIAGGLKMAYDYIVDLDKSQKQVMLITDGRSFMAGPESSVTVARNMRQAGIFTSVFNVDENGATNGSNNTLSNIASAGGGEFFQSKSQNGSLNDVLFGNVMDDVSQTVIEERTAVSVARRTDELLEGINAAAIPDVAGFVTSKIKPSATTVLTLEHEEEDTTQKYPLYAYWTYGNGTVASFTSQPGDRAYVIGTGYVQWLKDWRDSGFEKIFFESLLRVTLPTEKTVVPFTTQILREGNVSEVTITPVELRSGAVAGISVTMPNGATVNRQMSAVGPSYTCQFDTSQPGKYRVEVIYNVDNADYRETKILHYAYSDEYDAFEMYDPSALYQALNGRGNVSLNGLLSLENEDNAVEMYKVDLTVPLMITVVALYVIDVAVRKLKWEDIKSFFGFAGKKKAKKSGGKQQ